MTLYLDTEYNAHGGSLISLALVSNTFATFYGVVDVPRYEAWHPWVKRHVRPYLGQAAEPRGEFRARLHEFLQSHEGEEIIADWPDDFAHLMREMAGPSYEESWMVECSLRLIKSGEIKSRQPHNALSDAEALMHWHLLEIAA